MKKIVFLNCRYFEKFCVDDYARSGNEATEEVILEGGALPEFSHSMEPQLRQLGLPTTLKKGKVFLSVKSSYDKECYKLTATLPSSQQDRV